MDLKAHQEDTVTIGQLIRWIDTEHINAARENPPNLDYMKSMQKLGLTIEHALELYKLPLKNK